MCETIRQIQARGGYVSVISHFSPHEPIVFTPPRLHAHDLGIVPSPYLLGVIDPKDYEWMWIETKRGCPFKCSYCNEFERPFRLTPLNIVEGELRLALEKGVKQIICLDSSLNSSANFSDFCKLIKKVNAEKKLVLCGTGNAELLSEKDVRMLREYGFKFFEAGLQSVDTGVLSSIGRPTKKFFSAISVFSVPLS